MVVWKQEIRVLVGIRVKWTGSPYSSPIFDIICGIKQGVLPVELLVDHRLMARCPGDGSDVADAASEGLALGQAGSGRR